MARPSKGTSQKKIVQTNWNVHYHWHGRRMPTDDNRSELVVRTGDIVKAHFPCIFAGVIETPWYSRECHATSCLSCSSCHSRQAAVVPALPQQLHSQRRHSGTRHARFLHPASWTSSERAQELPTVPIFVTEKVHVGIERNRAVPTKWRTQAVDAWAVHGIIMVVGRKASKKCAAGATRGLSWIFRSI